MPKRNLITKPPALSYEHAACLPTAWLTAYRMPFTRGAVVPGKTILIQAAAGGVATALTVLGSAAGIRVWVTSRSEERRAEALTPGADQAFDSGAHVSEIGIAVGDDPGAMAITPDQAPVAALSVTPAAAGQPTSFNASASTAPSSPIATYAWSFGDETTASTSLPTTTHVYAEPGTYTATLTETDGAGTSTTQVFTGQTLSRNGGSGAQASRTVAVGGTLSPAVFASDSADNTVTAYAQNASGNAVPLLDLSGSATALDGPAGVFVDKSGQVHVANSSGNTITEYATGATGNTAPLSTISGSATGLDDPQGVTMNADGNLVVSNAADNTITEYAAGGPPAKNGTQSPVATILGAATGLDHPEQLNFDAAGDLYVADQGDNTITEYSPGATGDAPPIATPRGSATDLSSPTGVLIDAAGRLRVANSATNTIATFTAGATGNTAPLGLLSGTATGLTSPGAMDVNAQGTIAVADKAANALELFAPAVTGDAARARPSPAAQPGWTVPRSLPSPHPRRWSPGRPDTSPGTGPR